jgi:hypothetical protein
MSGSGYRVIGYAVWHGGKWYLRRRLPSVRVLSVGAATVASMAAAAVLLARRNAD